MNTFQKFLTVVVFLMTTVIYSQTTVSGTVVDANGAVPGANVLEKGTSNGSSTDFDGNFSIEVQEGEGVLEISFVGMITTKFAFTATSGQNIDAGTITLSPGCQSNGMATLCSSEAWSANKALFISAMFLPTLRG